MGSKTSKCWISRSSFKRKLPESIGWRSCLCPGRTRWELQKWHVFQKGDWTLTVPHSTLLAPWVCLLTMVIKGLLGPMLGLTSLFLRLEETITSGLDQGSLLLCGADRCLWVCSKCSYSTQKYTDAIWKWQEECSKVTQNEKDVKLCVLRVDLDLSEWGPRYSTYGLLGGAPPAARWEPLPCRPLSSTPPPPFPLNNLIVCSLL